MVCTSASEGPMPTDTKAPAATTTKKPTTVASSEPPLTESDLSNIPEEFRPSEPTAQEAALVGTEAWVAKVENHTKDWSSATVKIGPPDSEFVQELQLKWNRKGGYYDVVRKKGIQ